MRKFYFILLITFLLFFQCMNFFHKKTTLNEYILSTKESKTLIVSNDLKLKDSPIFNDQILEFICLKNKNLKTLIVDDIEIHVNNWHRILELDSLQKLELITSDSIYTLLPDNFLYHISQLKHLKSLKLEGFFFCNHYKEPLIFNQLENLYIDANSYNLNPTLFNFLNYMPNLLNLTLTGFKNTYWEINTKQDIYQNIYNIQYPEIGKLLKLRYFATSNFWPVSMFNLTNLDSLVLNYNVLQSDKLWDRINFNFFQN